MLQEFIHDHKVYAIRWGIDVGSSFDETVVVFRSLNSAQAFFRSAAQNRLACEDLLKIAKSLQPTFCRPPRNCATPTSQELLDQLCLSVYQGDLILVEIKPGKPDLVFEACCVESLKKIAAINDSKIIIGIVVCIAQVHEIFASHTRLPGLISALSSAYNYKETDWDKLAKAMLSLNKLSRATVCELAWYEYHKHYEIDNNQELGKYWKRIYDASNV